MADLVPHIYHETQEQGSMLCGQHALNNLLQSSLFTAPDLADIARQLDALERAQLDPGVRLRGDGDDGGGSANYDDSGFFSVQVMEEALKVLGLRLIRWGSKEMASVHNQPERIEGFLLNHQLHWFSIRRFGTPERFYNLDSCIPQPQWISAMFLGLTLREAERQGYSIFAAVPAPESHIAGLPPCSATDRASALPPPRGAGAGASLGGNGSAMNGASGSGAAASGTHTRFGGQGYAPAGALAASGEYAAPAAMPASSATRKGKRPASPLDAVVVDSDDDDVIVEEPAIARRQRRRVGEPPTRAAAAGREGMSEEEMMAAAIAESLRVSSGGSEGGEGSGSGSRSGGRGTQTGPAADGQGTQPRAADAEEDEFQRALRASLAEAGGADNEADEAGEEDSPSMEELRRRRMARFG